MIELEKTSFYHVNVDAHEIGFDNEFSLGFYTKMWNSLFNENDTASYGILNQINFF